MLLKNKNIIITGCLRGIGMATMDLFAENGANIWACSEKKTNKFEDHIKTIQNKFNVWIEPVYFDFYNLQDVKNAAKAIYAKKKRIDALVNIAGITIDSLFHMISMENMKKVFEINFFSQILFTQYISKIMLRQSNGSIIFTSSITGLDGKIGQLSYGSSKASLISATKTLSLELASKGIRVNTIAPGVIKTGMTETVTGESLNQLINKSALKRIGLPIEVAQLLLFLSSDLSTYITGQVFRVDGGIG